MTSFVIQYLADRDVRPLRSFFTHDRALEEAEQLAVERSAGVAGVTAYRIVDMGGAVHLEKTIGGRERPV